MEYDRRNVELDVNSMLDNRVRSDRLVAALSAAALLAPASLGAQALPFYDPVGN